MVTNWTAYVQLYDNSKEEAFSVSLNDYINNMFNELIVDEKVQILFDNPKMCTFFEMIKLNEEKIKSISQKFIDFAIKKTQNNFKFNDSYKNKNDNDKLYNFYENMLKTTCFASIQYGECINCIDAAKNGHLGCLKYLHENGCPWDSNTCSSAAENGYLECLKYAHENGCSWNELTSYCAAGNGHLECLKYSHENGCSLNYYTCLAATLNGHLECFKYVRENVRPRDLHPYSMRQLMDISDTCWTAAENGNLECLKYAHENGCSWGNFTCLLAAQNGHLECLKYAHENGCPWDKRTCSAAAQNGHLECLKYAHENGCPWNESTCEKAAQNGHLECLKYARENGCP
ncbi:ankyrin repeat domain-containing protein [Bodo saltans virus]|uniref:Ankyrin repeat domain-containing protein n=1 Tax=Bodo saltans virus TaxID=2024608 RepID=A0A2H4UTB3_9VIRU|nr:ankyrin repeat domain-containing protein [Bodo saltans virus]ATZ80172.1 ankyrin repeat domain-containing protein [Bodo saltans virus]